jgi:hypothetical protein
MANGLKSGSKDSGSVGDLHGASSVSRNETTHDKEFAKGGNTPMFGEQNASAMPAAQTGKPNSSGGKGAEFAKGGSNKMFGFEGAQPAKAGITSAR